MSPHRTAPWHAFGPCGDVNSAASDLSRSFASFLRDNADRLLSCADSAPEPIEHRRARLESIASRLESLVLCAGWTSGFTVEPGDLAETDESNATDVNIRVYSVGTIARGAADAKKRTGWCLADFTLGSADPRGGESLLNTLTELLLSHASLTAQAPSLAVYLRDAIQLFTDPQLAQRQALPQKTSTPLPLQFVDNMKFLIQKRLEGHTVKDIPDEMRAKWGAKPSFPPSHGKLSFMERTPFEIPGEWCHYGWRLWVTVCEHIVAPILRGHAFTDALALWCASLLADLQGSAQDMERVSVLADYLGRYVAERCPTTLDAPAVAEGDADMVEMARDAVRRLLPAQSVVSITGETAGTPKPALATTVQPVASADCAVLHATVHKETITSFPQAVDALLRNMSCFDDTAAAVSPQGACEADFITEVSLPATSAKDAFKAREVCELYFLEVVGHLRSLTKQRTVCTEAKQATLASKVEEYLRVLQKESTEAGHDGCAWVPPPLVDQQQALLHILLAWHASVILRDTRPCVYRFTLVPPAAVCEKLFEESLVLTTTMKQVLLQMISGLREAEWERHFVFAYADDFLESLAQSPAFGETLKRKTSEWTAWAEKHSKREFMRYQQALAAHRQQENELGQLMKRGVPTKAEKEPIAVLRRALEKNLQQTFASVFLPFARPSHMAALFLPTDVEKLITFGEDAFKTVTGTSLRNNCAGVNGCPWHANKLAKPNQRPPEFKNVHASTCFHIPTGVPRTLWKPLLTVRPASPSDTFVISPMRGVRVSTLLSSHEFTTMDTARFTPTASHTKRPPGMPSVTTQRLLSSASTATTPQSLYANFIAPHAPAALEGRLPSSRENQSYCTPGLSNALTQQEWAQLYSVRSHRQTQVSRLLAALRGPCTRAVELFETDFIVQHYMVTLLSDAQAFVQDDAQAAMMQLPVLEEDIPACTARHAPLLLFLAATYAMCSNAARRTDVLLACVGRALELAQQLRRRCERAVDEDAKEADYRAMHRVSTIGLACAGFAPVAEALSERAFADRVLPALVALSLHRGLAQQTCGSACTSPYNMPATSGFYLLRRLLAQAPHPQQRAALTSALTDIYEGIFDAAPPSWVTVSGATLAAAGTFAPHGTQQSCAVDLFDGILFINGKTVGGLPSGVLQTALYKTLVGAGVPTHVYPLPQPAWYRSTTATALDAGHPTDLTSLAFSEHGDVGLVTTGDGYRLAALMSPAPVHADVGTQRHFHFVGRYATTDGRHCLDVVLFKPMPPGDAADTARPWLTWREGRSHVHFIAARTTAEDPATAGPFTLYAVPHSQRAAPLSASLPAALQQWDRVVTAPATLTALARLFPASLVQSTELLVTVPAQQQQQQRCVTITIPRMRQSFELTPDAVTTRSGYHLASSDSGAAWLRWPPTTHADRSATGATPAPFIVLCRDTSVAAAAVPADAMRVSEVVLWPSRAAAGAAGTTAPWAVTEVSRHKHFRYLQARTTTERLRLCALLLAHYPPSCHLSTDPRDGGLTVMEEVCALLLCCVSNRRWSVQEREALEELRGACDTHLRCFDHRAPLLVWLARLDAVRCETEALALATEGSLPPPPNRGAPDAAQAEVLRHAEDHVRHLMMRRLLSHRCVPPPELLRGTALERVHPLPRTLTPGGDSVVEAAAQQHADSVREAMARTEAVLRRRQAWAAQLSADGGALAVATEVREALGSAEVARAALQAAVVQFTTRLFGPLARACAAHPLATAGLQDAGRLAVCGVARWLRETAPWEQHAAPQPVVTAAATHLTAYCRAYVEACVLCDWLARLAVVLRADGGAAPREDAAQLELGSPREGIRAHPAWLVFEAEQRLAVREVQYATWQSMWAAAAEGSATAASPGLVTQLNMGEGKTRVVIPMLLLSELEERTGGAGGTPCVHALSAVAEELRRHLHDTLCTPGLRVHVLHKPFARSVQATPDVVRALRRSFARFTRGVLVEQREHYVSFLQKREEVLLERGGADDAQGLAVAHSAADRVRKAIAGATARGTATSARADAPQALPPTAAQLLGPDALHVYDEADELLSCRYNLVYSVGSETHLQDRELRCAIAERLLACCAQLIVAFPEYFEFTDPARAQAMRADTVQVEYPPCYAKHGADMAAFGDEVLRYFLQAPPPVCAWMARLPAAVRHLVTTPTDLTSSSFSVLGSPQADMVAQVECLRGFFQHGLLRFVLAHRANVSFGVPPPWRATKMAVPYEAADLPSQRSEFAQPDIALTLTYLAYMQRGLTRAEFRQALDLLLRLPDAQRDGEYEKWCAAGEGGVPLGDVLGDGVPAFAAMIDVQDAGMVAAMHTALHRRMAVVAFWVYHFVLEAEGRYHSHTLRATAWDIAAQRRMVGFSGTKDGCALMPATLVFRDHPDTRIAGSTQRMSQLIERHARPHVRHLCGSDRDGALSQDRQLVWCAVRAGACDVLIDLGALLAGTSPHAVAQYACALIEADASTARHRGICFFDHLSEQGWVVMDVATQQVWPLETAPLTAAECFVIYDQARCRGADLKLRADAHALVSLARGTQRDALLQAVGRLRLFGRNQTLEFVATPGVAAEIDGAGNDTTASAIATAPARVLRWAERNTEEALSHAIPEFVGAAAHHLAKAALGPAQVHTVPTPTSCSALYRAGYGKVTCRTFAKASLARFAGSAEAALVIDKLEALAGDALVPTVTASATTERELQQESEREKQTERETEEALTKPYREPFTDTLPADDTHTIATWCERVLGVASFAALQQARMYFAEHFLHVRADVDAADPQHDLRTRLPALRQIHYIFVDPRKRTVHFLTQYQAAARLHAHSGKLLIDHSHAPLVFLAHASPAASPEEAQLTDYLRDIADAVAVFARFFNGETYFTAREREPLRSLLYAPISAMVQQAAATEGDDANPTATADALFYFHKCRKTLSLLPGSALEEVYFELLHDASLSVRRRVMTHSTLSKADGPSSPERAAVTTDQAPRTPRCSNATTNVANGAGACGNPFANADTSQLETPPRPERRTRHKTHLFTRRY